jgi:hypothetical protein
MRLRDEPVPTLLVLQVPVLAVYFDNYEPHTLGFGLVNIVQISPLAVIATPCAGSVEICQRSIVQ